MSTFFTRLPPPNFFLSGEQRRTHDLFRSTSFEYPLFLALVSKPAINSLIVPKAVTSASIALRRFELVLSRLADPGYAYFGRLVRINCHPFFAIGFTEFIFFNLTFA